MLVGKGQLERSWEETTLAKTYRFYSSIGKELQQLLHYIRKACFDFMIPNTIQYNKKIKMWAF